MSVHLSEGVHATTYSPTDMGNFLWNAISANNLKEVKSLLQSYDYPVSFLKTFVGLFITDLKIDLLKILLTDLKTRDLLKEIKNSDLYSPDDMGKLFDHIIPASDPDSSPDLEMVELLFQLYDFPHEVLSAFIDTAIDDSNIELLELLVENLRKRGLFRDRIKTTSLECIDDLALNSDHDGRLEPLITQEECERMKEIINPSSTPDTEPLMPDTEHLELDTPPSRRAEYQERPTAAIDGGPGNPKLTRTLERTHKSFFLLSLPQHKV